MTDSETARTCRICLEADQQNTLIAPCQCRGSAKYVHRKCLDTWRSYGRRADSFTTCDVCHFTFHLEAVRETEHEKRRRERTYKWLVTRDLLIGFLLWISVTALLGLLIRAIDADRVLQSVFPDWFAHHGLTAYFIWGFLAFLCLLGIGWCCMQGMGCLDEGGCLYISPMPHRHLSPPPDCCCFVDCRGCDCNDCNCPHGSSSNNDCKCDDCGQAIVVLAVIVLVMFVFVGFVAFCVAIGSFIQRILQRHLTVLHRQMEAQRWIVFDFGEAGPGPESAFVKPSAPEQDEPHMSDELPPRHHRSIEKDRLTTRSFSESEAL